MIDTGFDWMLAPLVLLVLLGGMLLSMEVGMRARARHLRAAQGDSTGFAAVHGAVFALMGLLMAFTFSGAASRFDHRRDLIVEEANDIGTAYLGSRFSLKRREGLCKTSFANTWTPDSRPIAPEPTSCESDSCCSKPLNTKVRFGKWRWQRSTMPRVHPWRH